MRNVSKNLLVAGAVSAFLLGCASTPETYQELEAARAVVPQVEASPRAGVAATYIAEARKSLDRANRLADKGAKVDDIKYEANLANLNAAIANEKILAAQAREELDKGTAERQAVLIEAREAEAQRRAAQAEQARNQAELARRQADEASERAKSLEEELAALKAKPTPRGMVLTLGDVLFDTAQATLKPGAYPTIDKVAEVLKAEPDRKLTIEGHTDSRGDDAYNQGLSERRAYAVQEALLQRGVSSNQIVALGKGESFPIASNDNAGGQQQNRRVELIFANDGSQVASDVQ